MGRYAKGAKLENQVREILEEDGWVAVRSAGSHGVIDVLGVKQNEKWFIQCRVNGNLSQDERVELINLAVEHSAIPILAYKQKANIIFEEIKLLRPTFHFEVIDGKFIKIDD